MTEPVEPDVPETVATYLRLRGLKPSSKNWKRKKRLVDDENADRAAVGTAQEGTGLAGGAGGGTGVDGHLSHYEEWT